MDTVTTQIQKKNADMVTIDSTTARVWLAHISETRTWLAHRHHRNTDMVSTQILETRIWLVHRYQKHGYG